MGRVVLQWSALLASIVSLPPLFLVGWWAAGSDGLPRNAASAVLGPAIVLSAFASVVAAIRQLVHEPTGLTFLVMSAPVVLVLVSLAIAGPAGDHRLRGDPRSRLTEADVVALGLDPADHGFGATHRVRDAVIRVALSAAPLLAPGLILATGPAF